MTRARRKNKPTAAENKLNALLGLTQVAEKVSTHTVNNYFGITEEEIQHFREAQGLIYFLRAPALFQPKVCKHCGEPFLVSRLYVALCSYTCIRKDLEARGFHWEKGEDIEALVNDPEVYQGNEPIWIRKPLLSQALEILRTLLETNDSTATLSESLSPPESKDISSVPLQSDIPASSSPLAPTTTTPSNTTVRGKTSSRKNKPSRKITFGG